ncbi:MAG: thioredoxin family protein [Planctomycetota bacterium]|nr:thioredoxin family protein [Planctomycetota bacterium]
MQFRQPVLIAALMLGLGIPLLINAQTPAGPQPTDSNQWLSDYGFARREADRLGLPLLIHFSATWCAPCQQMERETLNSAALRSLLGTQLIALKIDSDEDPGLVEAFRVESLPTDVIVAPNSQGRIISRSSGYQSKARYMANASHWSKQFPNERAAAIARLTPPVQSAPSSIHSEPIPSNSQHPFITPSHKPLAPGTIVQSPDSANQQSQLVGLSGYSPVAIKTRRVWAKGHEKLSVTWQGVVYYMSNDREYAAFKNAPHRYAPRMLGCDPVVLWQSDRAVQGIVDYGAFYDGELYLFTTAETRDRFKVNPDQFVRVRHVLNPDEVIGTRIR